jgi:hypothetical protein
MNKFIEHTAGFVCGANGLNPTSDIFIGQGITLMDNEEQDIFLWFMSRMKVVHPPRVLGQYDVQSRGDIDAEDFAFLCQCGIVPDLTVSPAAQVQ